ncbi:MAG: hypothetical protein V8S98_00880 [Lachnospiraceae bacterium]
MSQTEKGVDMSGRKIIADLYSSPSHQYLMEAVGFYRAVTSRSRMTVVFVMAFSVALAV